MTKKLILPALVLLCMALFATNGFAQCSSGVNPIYVAIGSSAQFNTFAFAAEAVLPSQPGYVGPTNFWASSSWSTTDSRTTLTDGGGKIWVAFDSAATCNMYTYMSFDSTIGVKSFNAWAKQVSPVSGAAIGAIYGATSNTFGTCANGAASPNAGQPNCASTTTLAGALPAAIKSFLTTPAGPTCKYTTGTNTSCTKSTPGALPQAYCSTTDTVQTTAHYCFFNAGHSDVRPDDALYATKRALTTTFNGPAGLTSLGYGQAGCGATGTGTKVVGCTIYEAFGKGGSFNVASFALPTQTASTTDPYSAAVVPPAVTINIGAAPILVFVNDNDTSANGFGSGAPSDYAITNINSQVLAGIEDGTFGCVGDVGDSFGAKGNAIQVIQREPLSGTYNTFEFDAVRRVAGSASTAVPEEDASSIKWFTDDDSGQELGNNPTTNYSTCGGSATAIPSAECGDPKYVPSTHITCADTNSSQLRAVGTGEEVKATLGLESTQTSSNPQLLTPNGLGYAFWGYGNFAPAASGCTGTATGVLTAGCTYLGHYLTVDGIDPLFTSPGGAQPLTVAAANVENPNGGYHLPQCYLGSGLPKCFAIPFTHILDGSYPIWTILRAQTFAAYATDKITTPPAVLQIFAQAEKEASGTASDGVLLDDFIPYFTNVNNTVSPPTGDLNLGVYRTHYENGSTVAASNGYANCGDVFTGLSIAGAPGTCGVDTGGDVGGAVFTVQSDADFHADWGSVKVGTSDASEIYALHQ